MPVDDVADLCLAAPELFGEFGLRRSFASASVKLSDAVNVYIGEPALAVILVSLMRPIPFPVGLIFGFCFP